MTRFDKQVLSRLSCIQDGIYVCKNEIETSHPKSNNTLRAIDKLIALEKQKSLLESYMQLSLRIK